MENLNVKTVQCLIGHLPRQSRPVTVGFPGILRIRRTIGFSECSGGWTRTCETSGTFCTATLQHRLLIIITFTTFIRDFVTS